MSQLMDHILESMRHRLDNHGIKAEIDLPQGMPIPSNTESIRRAVEILIVNAIDSMETGGELLVTGVVTDTSWEIEIADSGTGIADEPTLRIFDPDRPVNRYKDGFAMVSATQIVERFGGSIAACNCPQGGTARTMVIPRNHSISRAA